MKTRIRKKQEQDLHVSNEPSAIADAIAPCNAAIAGADTAAVPEKRADREQESPPRKYQKVEIPWSATLPQVVWVCDDERFWWPGKV